MQDILFVVATNNDARIGIGAFEHLVSHIFTSYMHHSYKKYYFCSYQHTAFPEDRPVLYQIYANGK